MIHVQTAHNVTLALEPAGLGDRILAYVIDIAILLGYNTLMWLFLFAIKFGSYGSEAVMVALFSLPWLLYFPVFEIAMDGQTPGKKARKIRVVRLDGEPPSIGDYLLRWLLGFVDFTISTGAVAVTSIALSQHSQRLGDMAAGTTVVSARDRARLSDTLFERIDHAADVTYPEAARLSNADVSLIRDAIRVIRIEGVTVQSRKIAQSVIEVIESAYGITTGEQRPYFFLRTLLQDYTTLAGTADAAFEPVA